jgi:pyruvate/2-oxoglutarate/acetoin dehydrogenase E1 component/TPP-dependent pyruvate/acetoin dehydrogenase alpha subunit
MNGGRQMTGHFSTPNVDHHGNWINQTRQYNSASDISSTAGQMPRLLGLAQASKVYRNRSIKGSSKFSVSGDEIAWGTIGNASTSEGLFFEVMNAAGVMQVPMVMSVWDDEYGISVPAEFHTIKQSISDALKGFSRNDNTEGFEIIKVKGWDYPALIEAYGKAEKLARVKHVPVLVHVTELTQPQGHSTSGSHERYKSEDRLAWEQNHDCLRTFKQWILENKVCTQEELNQIDEEIHLEVQEAKKTAFKEYQEIPRAYARHLSELLSDNASNPLPEYKDLLKKLNSKKLVFKKDTLVSLDVAKNIAFQKGQSELIQRLNQLAAEIKNEELNAYSSELIDEGHRSLTAIPHIPAVYPDKPHFVDGRRILQENFDILLDTDPRLMVFGEDTGKIGGVNKALEDLQEKYGEDRVSDTSIREASIIGQGIGLAMRGLRPIAEIQYLDYIFYAIQVLTDDLATLRYRSVGQQIAPLIVRTRGHRLEGIWHSGSPMGGLVNILRGIYILSPRNMTQAAGMYNALLKANEPAIVIEPLNGYRSKEALPENIGHFTTPIGEIEVIEEGSDITVVSYGSTLKIVCEASERLHTFGISCEIIDVQTLWPFDKSSRTVESLKKTNRLAIIDEDVPGGYSAFLLQHIISEQKGFSHLDTAPLVISAKQHRPPYGSDGDYFSKPNAEEIFEGLYNLMRESRPDRFKSW